MSRKLTKYAIVTGTVGGSCNISTLMTSKDWNGVMALVAVSTVTITNDTGREIAYAVDGGCVGFMSSGGSLAIASGKAFIIFT